MMMAGGLGTRLSPYTNILPKPLIPIGDYPIAEHIINSFRMYGCNRFFMIVNYKRNMIKAYFDELEKNYQLEFVVEETKAYRQHRESQNVITMVCSLKNFTIPYGVVNIGKDGMIESMQEKPNMSFFTNTGCYFVEPEVIEDLAYNEPVDFPDIIERYMAEGKKVGIYPIGEDAWLDMGQFDELEKMKERLGC